MSIRHTGVIVGVDRTWTEQEFDVMSKKISQAFPNVSFAFVTGAQSVAFDWDEQVVSPAAAYEPPPPPPPNSGTRLGRPKRSDRERPETGKASL